jgi:hypothetical protein
LRSGISRTFNGINIPIYEIRHINAWPTHDSAWKKLSSKHKARQSVSPRVSSNTSVSENIAVATTGNG